MDANNDFATVQEFFEYGQDEIENLLLRMGYVNSISKRYWIKHQVGDLYFTVQFIKTKRLTGFTLHFGLFLPILSKKPKPRHELIYTCLNEITDIFKPQIEFYNSITSPRIKIHELKINLSEVIIPYLEEKLKLENLKKTFPNLVLLNDVRWLPEYENMIMEYLDKH